MDIVHDGSFNFSEEMKSKLLVISKDKTSILRVSEHKNGIYSIM